MATAKSIYIKQSKHCDKNCTFFFCFSVWKLFLIISTLRGKGDRNVI